MSKLAALAMILVAFGLPSFAQSDGEYYSGSNFQGRIRYDNNRPAAFVRVELWSDGETTWRTFATTDRNGNFYTGAPCMVVQYRVTQPGFSPVYGRVDISTHPCTALESITLRPLPGTTPPGGDPAPSGTVDARVAAIPDEAKAEFALAQHAIDKDDFAGAAPHLQKAIEFFPRYAEAYQLLALAQLKTRRGPDAEVSLRKAIEIEDKLPQAQHLLGVLLAMTARADQAEKPLSRFAELDPANPDAQFELAKVTFALNRFDRAEAYARKAIELNEKDGGVQMVLAYSLLRQGKAAGAREAFQNYLKRDPNSPMKADVENMIAKIEQHEKLAK